MASSAVAALKKALHVGVCVMLLLHFAMGQQPPTTSPASTSSYTATPPPPPPPPGSPGCPYSGQQPPPSPTPVLPPAPTPMPSPTPTPTPTPSPTPLPAPMPTPTPAPAPAPVACNISDCGNQCTSSCQASFHPQNCTALVEGAFNSCYGSCTNHTCPGKSCVHSGCGFGNCSCDNPHAVSCCNDCAQAVSQVLFTAYRQCQSYNERYIGNCMMNCIGMCTKNCTQGA